MALTGDAFLAIWHDIEPDSQEEYMEWHTREHMPERVSIPGFRAGKRLINHGLSRYRYGTIYTGDDVEVFRSPAYLERLNAPTEWTLRVQPAFRNFLRVACLRLASSGAGEGGAVATLRCDFAEGGGEADLRARAAALAGAVLRIRGVCCAHVGVARPEVSAVRTRETELRPEMGEKGFDALVIAEGSGLPELEAALDEIRETVTAADCALTEPQALVHNLAYHLSERDLDAG